MLCKKAIKLSKLKEQLLQQHITTYATYELKADKFKPEHLGQLNFYLEALDRDVNKPDHSTR